MQERGFRELFVEVDDCGPCPWCGARLREFEVDGVECESCRARSLPRADRRALESR